MKKSYINTIYNPQRRPFTSYPQQLASEILTRFNLRSGSSLLDFGCGRGEMSSAFDNIGFKVISCDRESVLTKYYDHLCFCQADFEAGPLPFEDSQFDIVFSKSVIEHLRDPLIVWNELHRILKPGGCIITLCPSWEYNYRWFYEDFTHVSPFQRSLSMTYI